MDLVPSGERLQGHNRHFPEEEEIPPRPAASTHAQSSSLGLSPPAQWACLVRWSECGMSSPTLMLRLGPQWAVWGGVWVTKAESQECHSLVSGFSWTWISHQENRVLQSKAAASTCVHSPCCFPPGAEAAQGPHHTRSLGVFSFQNQEPNKTLL